MLVEIVDTYTLDPSRINIVKVDMCLQLVKYISRFPRSVFGVKNYDLLY